MEQRTEFESGMIQEFLVVPLNGVAYDAPEKGTSWTIRLQGREPGRYDPDRMTRDAAAEFELATAFDFTMHVQFVSDEEAPGQMTYIEGYAKAPVFVGVTAWVRIGSLGMPRGLANVLVQNEVRPTDVGRMSESAIAPVGRARLVAQ